MDDSVSGSLIVRCACGWETRGTEDEVVAATAAHGELRHNMRATREQILAMAVPGEAGARSSTSRHPAPPASRTS